VLALEPEIIRDIARLSFATGHIPEHCRQTQGTLIPKKAQGKYRVVHVATPMAAYLEIIALNRLEYALETNKLKDPNQYGFTRNRGRHDLVANIITGLARHRTEIKATYGDKATAQHNQTTVISHDVAGAFDNIGQAVIIKKLYKELYQDPIRHWLKAFILNRSIRVKINNLVSKDLGVHRGVPQGAALGPILRNYSIEDIRKLAKPSPTLQLLAYANDLTIVSHGNQKPWQTQRLLDQINHYIKSKGLMISTEKSELMHIIGPGRRPKDQDLPEYYIPGRGIRQEEHIKILGIPINKFMELRIEDESTNEKLAKTKRLLRFLKIHNIVASSNDWQLLSESLLKSVLVHNFIPLMATDNKARIWADKNLLYGIMYTLGLPR